MLVSVLKPRFLFLFNMSEHCCAIGYAASEFALEHSHIFLTVASACLVAALVMVFLCSCKEHLDNYRKGYRNTDNIAL